MSDISVQLQQQVSSAIADKTVLNIIGGNSKSRLTRSVDGRRIELADHQGITSYEPTELVLSARSGTRLQEIEQELKKNNQMLAFEPPHFTTNATLGGTVACNLSGPSRVYRGAARDFVLGTKIINGNAQVMKFGGEVMKNVAGYDVSRLMCGAMGSLGVLLEISVKVLPRPASEISLVQEIDQQTAIIRMNELSAQALPLSASCWQDNKLYLRLSGATSAVHAAQLRLGGELLQDDEIFWQQLREHQLSFFNTDKPLWRLSVPPTYTPLEVPGECLIEWAGGQRWLKSDASAEQIFAITQAAGGHAKRYANNSQQTVCQPLQPELLSLHRNLKQAFDPHGILNPGIMYPEF
ncbi:MAG: glycolate oxidase subunit GlcE [Gammaproteobacteria bacterium]|nr:glycolate oxidase subunit GlcE [Gammaproteobacteria bacterium]